MSVSSYDPRTGEVASQVDETTRQELAAVLQRATAAAPALAALSPAERRRCLYRVAEALEAHRDELVEMADRETALGSVRLSGEVTRTAAQLRFYGDVAREGSYLGVTIDEATEASPRLVRGNRPLGPVAVFGASNFPFAFSVLGHDTGAALAAGCPVVVKAHPAHLALSMRQAEIARDALAASGAPEGSFDIVVGHETGVELVRAPEITAVAFTGSQSGGLALWRIANEREVVIPVYAEMGTVNPVVVTRSAAGDMASVASGFVGSFTLGHGQFCTKPGLMLAPEGAGAADAVAAALRETAASPVMLTRAIAASVVDGITQMEDAGAHVVERLEPTTAGWGAPAAVLRAGVSVLKPGSRLLEECFGAVVLICEYSSDEELTDALATLQCSLAASLITSDVDDSQAMRLLGVLSGKVGRVVVNDWPTGVALTWAQQHGGPWPSTSVPSATSVGAHGLARFVRPVAFQSAPDALLPTELRADNPWGLPRRINGRPQPGTELWA